MLWTEAKSRIIAILWVSHPNTLYLTINVKTSTPGPLYDSPTWGNQSVSLTFTNASMDIVYKKCTKNLIILLPECGGKFDKLYNHLESLGLESQKSAPLHNWPWFADLEPIEYHGINPSEQAPKR